MTQAVSFPFISTADLARQGNLKALSIWINQRLMQHGLHAYVGIARPHRLRVIVEFRRSPNRIERTPGWRDRLVRYLCYHLCQLNSTLIERVSIVGRYQGSSAMVWERSVRLVTPATRQRRQETQHLRRRVRRSQQQKHKLRRLRVMVTTGPAIAALMVGAILGYGRAPSSQTAATAKADAPQLPQRPDEVKGALETIPVIKHNKVLDPKDPTVTLMFGGDVTLADSFAELMGKDYGKAFAKLDEYRQADLAMVNLENPLTKAANPMPDKQFNFKSDPESVKVLQAGGVDVVTIANNHSMDFQAAGLQETMTTLDQAGIQHIGAGENVTQARRPDIIDVKGQRIAYLAYYGEEYGAEANKPGVNSILEQRIAEDIKAIRDQVDWVVVNYHWGQESADYPADWQTQLGRFTIDHGADLVVGHHPHVLQGAEIYRGRPIVYSLGNFIFGGNSRADYDTAVLKVALNDQQMKVEFLPIEVKDYQPQVVSGDKGQKILDHLAHLSSGFKQPMQASMVLDARTRPAPDPSPGASPSPAPLAPTTPSEAPLDLSEPRNDSAPSPTAESSPAPDGAATATPTMTPTVESSIAPSPAPSSSQDAEVQPSDPLSSPSPTIAPSSISPTPSPEANPESLPTPPAPTGSFTTAPEQTPVGSPAMPNSQATPWVPPALPSPTTDSSGVPSHSLDESMPVPNQVPVPANDPAAAVTT